ncbi:MAG: 6-phosphogluconolactonase [Candidatus Saccharimonadales bacterium]
MRFLNVPSEVATAEIIDSINRALQAGSALLLVSGGSNIQLAVTVRDGLKITNQLTLGLIDERYGPIGHPNSNWAQLLNAGLNPEGLQLLPVMIDDGVGHEQAAASYRERLQAAIANHNTVIGIFGIGDDGHTSGILPRSPAITATETVIAFMGHDFPRVTATPAIMPLINKAFLVSYGEHKHDQLIRLTENLSIADQPAQALKQIADLTIYSDLKDND